MLDFRQDVGNTLKEDNFLKSFFVLRGKNSLYYVDVYGHGKL